MTLAELIAQYNDIAVRLGKPIRKSFKNKADAEQHIESISLLLPAVDESSDDLHLWPKSADLKPRRNDIPVQKEGTTCDLESARRSGFVMYWNGSPCSKGHYAPRYSSDGKCKQCYKEYQSGLRVAAEVCKEKS